MKGSRLFKARTIGLLLFWFFLIVWPIPSLVWPLKINERLNQETTLSSSLSMDEADLEKLELSLSPMSLEQALKEINRQIEEAVCEDRFSGVVLIAHHFKPIYFQAWGMANREFNVPNRLDTKFNLGSINKIFTKIAIGQLVEKGQLSFEDKLGKWLPEYPNGEAKDKVKVRHLIEMTSGIGDFFGPEFEKTPKDFIRHNRDYLPLFALKPLAFEPGTKQLYSNGSYVVLGEIISRVSGLDYYDFIKAHIFDVAGMKDSAWYEADEIVPNLAEGYTEEVSGKKDEMEMGQKGQLRPDFAQSGKTENQKVPTRRKNIYTRPARGSAAGGGYSTAEDLLKFIEALAQCRFLSAEMTDWVFGGPEPQLNKPAVCPSQNPDQLKFGSKESGREISPNKNWNLAIAGGAPGINAVLEFEAKSGWTIIVLANLDPPSATSISRMIRRYLPKNRDT